MLYCGFKDRIDIQKRLPSELFFFMYFTSYLNDLVNNLSGYQTCALIHGQWYSTGIDCNPECVLQLYNVCAILLYWAYWTEPKRLTYLFYSACTSYTFAGCSHLYSYSFFYNQSASVMNRKIAESLIQQANPETNAPLLAAAFVCSTLLSTRWQKNHNVETWRYAGFLVCCIGLLILLLGFVVMMVHSVPALSWHFVLAADLSFTFINETGVASTFSCSRVACSSAALGMCADDSFLAHYSISPHL